jgi:hypothetical protein
MMQLLSGALSFISRGLCSELVDEAKAGEPLPGRYKRRLSFRYQRHLRAPNPVGNQQPKQTIGVEKLNCGVLKRALNSQHMLEANTQTHHASTKRQPVAVGAPSYKHVPYIAGIGQIHSEPEAVRQYLLRCPPHHPDQ